MSGAGSPITADTKVAALLDEYPELEPVLIEMAPPFKKLRNPLLRRSVAKVATLRQAAAVGRLPVDRVVNALRAAVGQPPLETADGAEEGGAEAEPYFTTQPEWFDRARVVSSLDEARDISGEQMAIITVLQHANRLAAGEILELHTGFLPAPGIDLMRAKGFRTWSVEDAPDRIRTYFIRRA